MACSHRALRPAIDPAGEDSDMKKRFIALLICLICLTCTAAQAAKSPADPDFKGYCHCMLYYKD